MTFLSIKILKAAQLKFQTKQGHVKNAIASKQVFIVYSNSLAFSLQISLINFKCFLKQSVDSGELFSFG